MLAAAALYMEDSITSFRVGDRDRDMDMELVSRCRARDAAALREVYLTHRKGVWGVVSRMISNEADREELVQDVFLQVFRSLEGFKGTSRLSTWVHRVAVNVTLQHIRGKGRRIRIRFKEELPEQPAAVTAVHAMTPEDSLARDERRAAVRRALDSIAPKKRAVLVLADFEGLSSQEIARIVDASALTVRTRLFYARKVFYAKLAAEPAFSDLPFDGGDR